MCTLPSFIAFNACFAEPESSTDVEPESDEAGSGAESGREGAGQVNSKKDK